jgi:hypothetical protein
MAPQRVNTFVTCVILYVIVASSAQHDIGYIEQKYATCIITRVKIMHPMFLCNLMEWIEYHHVLGMSHIFIVDDCSPVRAVRDVLRFYRRRGVVTPFQNMLHDQNICATSVPDESRLGHLMFKRHAQHLCSWVTYIDMDEFLTAWNVTDFSLERVLSEYAVPFFRLPWWVVGSDAHETRPKAMVIDAYTGGKFEPALVKTIAKSDEIWDFSLTHYPHVTRPQETLGAFNMTRHAFAEQHRSHPFERTTMNLSGTPAEVPATAMFLKHYTYMSWEEFKAQRANFTYNSGGQPTIWAIDPRNQWLQGDIKPPLEIAQDFTSNMSARVLASFRSEYTGGRLPCSFCHAMWNLS